MLLGDTGQVIGARSGEDGQNTQVTFEVASSVSGPRGLP
jgi:hypothetical protein